MASFRQQVMACSRHIAAEIRTKPSLGFITGTGLSDTLTDLKVKHEFPYTSLPHFPKTTVESHRGCLVYGSLSGQDILVFQGRFHLYEGYSPQEVTFPVRLLQELGVEILVLSNAAGGINLNYHAGDIMVIQDHINLTGKNPLTGPNEAEWGLRFPDMTRAWDPELRALALETAAARGLDLKEGVYAGLPGPSLETPAETRYLKAIGGDAVGFSTIMEAIAGVHAGMRILGLSLITNINDPDAPEQTTLEAVVETAARSAAKMNRLLAAMAGRLP